MDPNANKRARDPLIGTCLSGRFQLNRRLGQGAMGTVYEATQLPAGRRCAVKVLRQQLQASREMRQRFLREARAVSMLNHPNLVTLYDFGVEPDNTSFIAMEFLEGQELAELLPFTGMSLPTVMDIARQILLALAEVHAHNIIHRDLKPENVHLQPRPGGQFLVKVLDFGLAKMLQQKDEVLLTATGEIYGTPLYMSPEQTSGVSDLSPATDVYAFGTMLYELLCGQPPFTGKTPLVIMTHQLRSPIPPVRPRPDIEVSVDLAALIYRCLTKKPDDRLQNAAEVLSFFDTINPNRLMDRNDPLQPVAILGAAADVPRPKTRRRRRRRHTATGADTSRAAARRPLRNSAPQATPVAPPPPSPPPPPARRRGASRPSVGPHPAAKRDRTTITGPVRTRTPPPPPPRRTPPPPPPTPRRDDDES